MAPYDHSLTSQVFEFFRKFSTLLSNQNGFFYEVMCAVFKPPPDTPDHLL